jgi:6-pyruvoyltetrahydropterin/6-carboxytetrahydropterin synthase
MLRKPEYYTSRKRLNDIVSLAFRQPNAESHCSQMHGYALTFEFIFAAQTLDANNWVIDFGGMKSIANEIQNRFDHKTIITSAELQNEHFARLIADKVIVPTIRDSFSMELLAQEVAEIAIINLEDDRVALVECVVYENGKNAASANYIPHWYDDV